MEKNKVYDILRRLTDHTVPLKYRPIIRNWIINNKDILEKETAIHQHKCPLKSGRLKIE